ncbi:Hypothetical protein GLP15_2474 [Giardia lamblia P15]|uniref:Uncharacterized protein n=1 Tax=Giardia intestinalis (strain P15) TaxID=658858 RepID=E1F8R3_GIAIA|nr:Hypothetical protein GLP15_2474 [Giardia lamblia P15]
MDVWGGVLGTLREVNDWPAVYFLASYLQATEDSERSRWALYALQAVLSDMHLQVPPILTDLESRSDEYRREISLCLEQGKLLRIDLHIPWVVMSAILCLETNLWAAKNHLDSANQESCYMVISRNLSFASISFGHIHSHLHDEANLTLNNANELLDVAVWISNFMLYLSESLLKLSYYNSDCAELYIGEPTHQSGPVSQMAMQGFQEADCESRSKELTTTQPSEVSFLDLVTRCRDLYLIAESIRSTILVRLRDFQFDPPLALQLMTHLFWAPGQSFEDGVHSAKEIYKRLQGLTAVSLSQVSTSDGNFVSPENLQQECSNHAAYYNTDQLVASQLACLKVLQLLELAPVLSARPASIKRLQRLFLSSLRILEAHKHQEIIEPVLQQRESSSILAELAGIHQRNPSHPVACLRCFFYKAILNYYCNTPQKDLYDIILCNLDSISIHTMNRIEITDIQPALLSITEYVSVLLKTVDTCIANMCMSDHADPELELAGYIDSLYGLLICLPCRPDPYVDLIALTNSTISLLYYSEELRLQNTKYAISFTRNLFFTIAIQKLRRLFTKLVKLYTLILSLDYPVAQLETECFQERALRLLARKMQEQSRVDHQFITKKTIQQVKVLVLNHYNEDESGFSFATLAKSVSFMIIENANDPLLQESLQCILFYLMMDTPICLFDYITTARTIRELKANLISANNIAILLSTSKGLFAHFDHDTALNRFDNVGDDMQSHLSTAYSELLLALVLCSGIFS